LQLVKLRQSGTESQIYTLAIAEQHLDVGLSKASKKSIKIFAANSGIMKAKLSNIILLVNFFF
jgi:hypothetical protein